MNLEIIFLHTELHSASLEGRSIAEYVAHIKALVDALAFVGDHVPSQHIDLTLGLSQEFSSVIYVVESKFHMVQLWKLRRCFWLMRCIFKSERKLQALNQCRLISRLHLLLVTCLYPKLCLPLLDLLLQVLVILIQVVAVKEDVNIQCQVCFKFGHIASYCNHRFNQQFQPAIPRECHGQVGRDGHYELPNLKFFPIHQLKPIPPFVLILVLVLALVYSPLLMYQNIYLVLLHSIGT